jgi:hypothetical protein
MGKRGPQFGGPRLPDPDDEADRLENPGDVRHQGGGLTCLIEPAELDTERGWASRGAALAPSRNDASVGASDLKRD